MNDIMGFISSSIIIEGLISYADMIIDKDKHINWKIVGALAVGCIVAFNTNLDFFKLLGIKENYEVIGTFLTGVLISRGSNYVYDIYDKLINWKKGASE